MAYEQISKPTGYLYHYTQRANIDSILKDGKIRRMRDSECWFSTSQENMLKLMQHTVMKEGKPYYGTGGVLKHYPPFIAEDYVILKLKPSNQSGAWVRWNQELPAGASEELINAAKEFNSLKIAYRGDLKFQEHPEIIEVALLLSEQEVQSGPSLQM